MDQEASLDQLVRVDLPVLLESEVELVPVVHVEKGDHLALEAEQAHPDHLDHLDLVDLVDHVENLEPQEKLVCTKRDKK